MEITGRRREFLQRCSHGAVLGAVASVVEGGTEQGITSGVDISPQAQVARGHRQLFLDDVFIEHTKGLARTLHQPRKHTANPVIRQGQTAWNEYRSQLYGTVLYFPKERKFKMWYLSGAKLPGRRPIKLNGQSRIPNFQLVGYAESTDGFKWELPRLGLVEYNGSRDNNICKIARTNVEGIAVLHDPRDADPQRRFKAIYWEHSAGPRDPYPGISGISYSYSADGKEWRDDPGNPAIPHGSDTGQQLVWDETLSRYVAFGRFNAGGRKVARSESQDMVRWSKPQLVFSADGEDRPGTEIYGMGISRYEGLYVGLPWIFHASTSQRIDVQLTMSRDGHAWHRVAGRRVFIPNGAPGSWDAGLIFTASQPIQVKDDRIFIFYSASEHDHDYDYLHKDPQKGTEAWLKKFRKVGTSIGVATLRRDGFVSLDAEAGGGELITKPLLWPAGKALHWNLDATHGEVEVAVLNAEGTIIPGVTAIERGTDKVDCQVLSRQRARPLFGRRVRLRVRSKNASVFAWWLA